MTRFEPGDEIRFGEDDNIRGKVVGIEKVGEDSDSTIYEVEVPMALGTGVMATREKYIKKAFCEKHGTDTVYSTDREEWYCPFCKQ